MNPCVIAERLAVLWFAAETAIMPRLRTYPVYLREQVVRHDAVLRWCDGTSHENGSRSKNPLTRNTKAGGNCLGSERAPFVTLSDLLP
jgi:hypothetical protein